MNRHRLFAKFAFTFILFVLLPFMIILCVLLARAATLQTENDIAQNENLASQTANTVWRQTELAENMCKTVMQNQRLTTFLDMPYESIPDLNYYVTTIRDFVKVTNGVSDIKLRIYLENETIPLGFGVFYPMGYIDRTQTFREFCALPQDAVWLDGNFDSDLLPEQRMGDSDAFHYFHKIKIGSRLIGVIEAVVPEHMFDVYDDSSETALQPVELLDCYIYNFAGSEVDLAQIETILPKDVSVAYTRNAVFSRKQMLAGPFDIIVITPRSKATAVSMVLALLIPTLFVVMMIGFFSYNRKTIRDINVCLDGMENAISNNFKPLHFEETRAIQKIFKRNDEISTLARRTQFLLSQINILLEQKVQEQTAAKEAQLMALQHQINPHFLYNTMEVFSSRMELAGLYEESGAISAFCRMLRYNINTKDLMTTLNEEVQQVKYYFAIQKVRHIPFEVQFDIPENLLYAKSIRFLLEPFVENSFKYRGAASPLLISIAAKECEDGIELFIQNNGQALSPQRLEELNDRFKNAPAVMTTNGEHIGLSNINARLKLFYGENHFIRVECENEQTVFRFLLKQ